MRRKHMEHEFKHALHSDWFRHVALIFVGVAGILIAAYAYANLAQSPLPTTLSVELTDTEGYVELGRNGDWQNVGSGMELEESDQIRVVGEGKATLSLRDGSQIRLNSDTHVALTSLSIRDLRIINETGEVYARIIPSPARSVTVQTDNNAYEALGTAFLIVNTDEVEGVEVYQSAVDVRLSSDEFVRVGEGKQYFVRNQPASPTGTVSIFSIKDKQENEFILWNAEQDTMHADAIRNLGLINEIN